jgi:hypothetical protein
MRVTLFSVELGEQFAEELDQAVGVVRAPMGKAVAGGSGKESLQACLWRMIATPSPASRAMGQSTAPAATAAANPP